MTRPLAFLVAALLAVAGPSRAEPAGAKGDAVARAQAHFRRGVDLYADGDYDAAGVEFARAHELAPNFRILYNLAQVAYQRLDYVTASSHFRRYLAEGGAQVAPGRRAEVEGELSRLEDRVGFLAVTCNLPGAELAVDDVSVGALPLSAPVAVNVGRRRLQVIARGAPPQVRLVTVAGRETARVHFEVSPPPRPPPRAPAVVVSRIPERPVPRPSTATRVSWMATGLVAAAAGVSGAVAWADSRELRDLRTSYPVRASELDDAQRRASNTARLTDALAIGAAALAVVSTILSFTTSGSADRGGR